MSLINDALRRAQSAQPQPPPPPLGPVPPRPVEPPRHARHNLALMVPIAWALLALLGLLVVWQWAQRERNATAPRQARALAAPLVHVPTPPPSASPPAKATAPAAVLSAPKQTDSPPALPTETVADSPAEPAPDDLDTPLAMAEPAIETVNSAAGTPPRPKPAPLRLQAIVFNPKRPSALINGKTLFVGDKLGDARVVAIDRESATLISLGKTNVLVLPE